MTNEDILATTADFQRVFDSPEGKNVLYHLMRKAGFLRTSFVSGDPYTSAFNEGQRALVLDIMEKLKVDIKVLEKQLMEDRQGDTYVSI